MSYAASQAYGISSEKMLSHLGITPQIAPASGTASWFEYGQLIDDWCHTTSTIIFDGGLSFWCKIMDPLSIFIIFRRVRGGGGGALFSFS